MQTSTKRRVFGVLGLVIATQLLSACIVLPVPGHRRHGAVVVQPGYGYGHGHGHHEPSHDRYRHGGR
ncbi:MAG: hypothetical protein IV105_17375 [Rhizobacter sp.]|nr:hypothetical protein [Rhizobacter sp.]